MEAVKSFINAIIETNLTKQQKVLALYDALLTNDLRRIAKRVLV